MIIGVTGYIASGKDTFCEILEKRGFKHLSLSDLLREDLKKRNIEITRERLANLGNDLRKKFGDEVLAKKALEIIDENDWLISSIGRVKEVKELKSKDFCLVFVDANQKIRYERLKNRNRTEDIISFEDFKLRESIEAKGGNDMFREFDNLKKEADYIIINNDSLKEFEDKINNFLDTLKNN